jgi:sigma-E factor negative regulatory protein RseA
MNEAIRMQLSAFADGELPDNEKELLLRRLIQDPDMRRQVAEYLAIGRVIRGEAPIPGIESLRNRVAASIGALDSRDDADLPAVAESPAPMASRLMRPFAGFATAAAVALLAIVGLQQMSDAPDPIAGTPAVASEASFSTQPAPDRLLDSYRLMHEAEASDNSMRARLTSIELRQGLAEEADRAVPPFSETADSADAPEAAAEQPATGTK